MCVPWLVRVCVITGNGTFLNGLRVSRSELRHGDVIGFGHGHDVAPGDMTLHVCDMTHPHV